MKDRLAHAEPWGLGTNYANEGFLGEKLSGYFSRSGVKYCRLFGFQARLQLTEFDVNPKIDSFAGEE